MNTTLVIFLAVHILAGFVSLITGSVSVATVKGGKAHRFSGRIFYWCMLTVAGTAIVLSIFRPNVFLLLIAFFGLYQNLNGYRAIRNKTLKPTWKDWLITSMGLLTGIVMITQMNLVLVVFGSLSIYFSISDFRSHIVLLKGKELSKTTWLARHISMMMGSYIATCTAFVVVNISFEPAPWLPWLLPTMILFPLIAYFQVKYVARKKPVKTIGDLT